MFVTDTIREDAPFDGDDEARDLNRRSHDFYSPPGDDAGDARCGRCDCRPSHVAASWPCGAVIPQQFRVVEHECATVEQPVAALTPTGN